MAGDTDADTGKKTAASEKKADGENPKAATVRKAASALADAIAEARGAGLTVVLPSRPEDFAAVAISETGQGPKERSLTGTEVQTVVASR